MSSQVLFILIPILSFVLPFELTQSIWAGLGVSTLATLLSTLILYQAHREVDRTPSIEQPIFQSRRELFSIKVKDPLLICYCKLVGVEEKLVRYGPEITYAYQHAAELLLLQFLESTMNIGVYSYGDFDFILVRKLSKHDESSIMADVQMLDHSFQALQRLPFPSPVDANQSMDLVISGGVATVSANESLVQAIEYARFTAGTHIHTGQSSITRFSQEQYNQLQLKLRKFTLVNHIIEANLLYPVFMPIINCETGELYGYEGLTRVGPDVDMYIGELMLLAEEMGVYVNLELAMTYNAIEAYRMRTAAKSEVKLFLNFAPETIKKRVYDQDISLGMFDGTKYVIEIIERGEILPELIATLGMTVARINGLVALDDFGTGFSNHLALLNTKPDIIKVARELLIDIDKDEDKQHAYANIVVFARNIGTLVLAEGIETEEEFNTLHRLGMDFAQGYFIGRPSKLLEDPNPRAVQLVHEFQSIL
jgi:EAL domain-containing protein (putative c-di-GMP-specific phosphodiesterase class I)